MGWRRRTLEKIEMREFHTPEAQALLETALGDKPRAHTTHRNLKAVLSAAFRFAKQKGAVVENPMRDTGATRIANRGNLRLHIG